MQTLPRPTASTLSRRQALRLLGLSGAAFAALPSWLRAAGAAPELAGAQPGFYRFRIGEFEALALADGGIKGPLPQMNWWANAENQAVVDALYASFEPPQIELGFSVVLVRAGNELVLVDTGCGNLFGAIGGKLPASLAAAGLHPDQVTTVILSHAHGDHMGGLVDPATGQIAFRNARHLVHGAEYDFWMNGTPDLSAVRLPADAKATSIVNARKMLGALQGRWERVNPGDQPVPGVTIVDMPGHTPGHVGVLFAQGNERLLHVADALHHHTLSFQHPEWQFAADVLPGVAIQTRRRIMVQAAAERTRIFGAHLPFPCLGHVRTEGDHFQYVFEPWESA